MLDSLNWRSRSGGSSDCLLFQFLLIANDLIRSTLDNAAGLGQLRENTHEVGINIASCLTALIDAPGCYQRQVSNPKYKDSLPNNE